MGSVRSLHRPQLIQSEMGMEKGGACGCEHPGRDWFSSYLGPAYLELKTIDVPCGASSFLEGEDR